MLHVKSRTYLSYSTADQILSKNNFLFITKSFPKPIYTNIYYFLGFKNIMYNDLSRIYYLYSIIFIFKHLCIIVTLACHAILFKIFWTFSLIFTHFTFLYRCLPQFFNHVLPIVWSAIYYLNYWTLQPLTIMNLSVQYRKPFQRNNIMTISNNAIRFTHKNRNKPNLTLSLAGGAKFAPPAYFHMPREQF